MHCGMEREPAKPCTEGGFELWGEMNARTCSMLVSLLEISGKGGLWEMAVVSPGHNSTW